MSILGPAEPFVAAAKMQRLRRQYIDTPELLIEDRLRLVEACDVFLELFRIVHIERDASLAAALAPTLNRHVPELMMRCPIKQLRPSQRDIDHVHQWYGLGEDSG